MSSVISNGTTCSASNHVRDTIKVFIVDKRSTPAHGTRPTSYGHLTYGPSSAGLTKSRSTTPSQMHRPKTAAAILGVSRDCDRVNQLEHEATRRHNLESHMPVKKNKPPPWQKSIDTPLVPFVVGPGYILSKSKSKFAVTLKDEFFEPKEEEEIKAKAEDNKLNGLIAQLQDRISDLTLYLEEERLNHKQTKQKADETLKSKIEDLEELRRNTVSDHEQQHAEEIDRVTNDLLSQHNEYKANSGAQISKHKKEIEFLQGAFESYKSTLHQEFGDKWKQKQEELVNDLEEQKNQEIHDMKTRIMQEKALEKAQMNKEFHRTVDNLRKEHKKDQDSLIRKYSNAASDQERLKRCNKELEETKTELSIVTKDYDQTCKKLNTITHDFSHVQMKLMEFEQQFDQKVQEVDDKYKTRIHELMTQNTELKRLYVGKCGELYDEKLLFERDRVDRVMTAKETMNKMLMSKHKADVNLAPGLREIQDKPRVPKVRPGSAPGTRQEVQCAALSAGETEHLKMRNKVENIRPEVILPEDSEEIEQLRKSLMEDVKSMSKDDLMKNISDSVS